MNSKQRKLLERMRRRPTPNDISFSDLEGLLLAMGAKKRKGKGDHVSFILGDAVITIPYRRQVKSVYIRHIIRIIDSEY